jgi:RNA polymerase sigma-70 factor (ECF subfamily)
MPDTSVSLLERLRLHPDPASWQRLIDLYGPLIQGWLKRNACQPADADDLSQDVLAVVLRELPYFQHDLRRGAFRRWLRTITVNRLRNFWRAGKVRREAPGGADLDHVINQLEDPTSGLSQLWDREHEEFVVRRLLEMLEPEFEPTTWRAFRSLMLEGKPTAVVAADVGISPNAVRIAKSRVLRRLRQEIDGLVD